MWIFVWENVRLNFSKHEMSMWYAMLEYLFIRSNIEDSVSDKGDEKLCTNSEYHLTCTSGTDKHVYYLRKS